jgi:hypothetical protein
MIFEWFEYMKTTCPKHLRAMGYLKELIGIQSRFKRNRSAWAPHLEQSRQAILDAANGCPQKRRVLIIGTGLWHDLPVAELCATFEQVVFADILHLPKMVAKARRYPNLSLIAIDATGLAERLYQAVKVHDDPLKLEPLPIYDTDFDLVVSLNVWSQLPVLLDDFLSNRTKMDEKDIETFCQRVIAGHLTFLKQFPGRVCLIADHKREALSDGNVIETVDTLRGIPFPPHDREWAWNLAPKPEQDPHADIRLHVRACLDL